MSDSTPCPIPVVCDRCRSTGVAGEADFSHLGDLLDFEPVPRKTERVDGWTPERQRAFIAALAATGSKRRAATSIGKADYGVNQLLKAEGSDGFRAAFDRAMAIAARNGTMKIAQGVADAAARNAAMTPPSRLRDWQPDEEPETVSDEQKFELLESLASKFLRKIVAEREARLAGEIVAADFYLRQVTMLEVMFDLLAADWGAGIDSFEALRQVQRGNHGLLQIVDTPFARMLDRSRRDYWAKSGEPERPPACPDHLLQDHGDRRTALDQHSYGPSTPPARGYTAEQWAEMPHEEQSRARQAQFEEDAEAQISWEAKARAEFEAHASSSSPERGGGPSAEEPMVEGAHPRDRRHGFTP